MTSIIKLFLTKYQIKVNNDNGSFMTTSILLQNSTFIISTIVIISTTAIISTILISIIIEKEHKRSLNISFDSDFQISKDLIIFINYTFHRNKFKRFKHFFFFFFFINRDKLKRFRFFTFIISLNIL